MNLFRVYREFIPLGHDKALIEFIGDFRDLDEARGEAARIVRESGGVCDIDHNGYTLEVLD